MAIPPFFDADAVRAGLDYPGCIAAVREAMADFSRARVAQPLRQIIEIAPARLFALMPGALVDPRGFGAKIITAYGDPARPGRSEHRGVVLLFERESGEVAALGDAGPITTIRTACASAVATDALARPDASTLGIFGCGALADSHIRAIPLVRPVKEILVWGRESDRAVAFAAHAAREIGIAVRAVSDPRDAAACDIVCTVTGAATPVLKGEWVRPGTHVNVVGSSHAGPVEVDTALVAASRYIADSRASVLAAGAEFLVARAEGAVDDAHIVAEIGEVLIGNKAGRTSDAEITLYKSLGHIVQDLAALSYLAS